jgi:Ser/Thr protein kinase RdoA (MazF antagonist)
MTVPALHSTLRPDGIAAFVAREYDLGGTPVCSVWHRGFNDYYLVDAPAGRFVLRVYLRDKYWLAGESDIRFELDFLAHAAANGVPSVPATPRRDGDVLGTIDAPEGPRFTALFAFAPGAPQELDAERTHALGGVCARIHAAGSSFETTHRRYDLDADLLLGMAVRELTDFFGGERSDDLRAVCDLSDRLRERMETIPKQEPSYDLIHADLHGGNCHWVDGEPTVLDFDHCGYGWRAYDFAAVIDGADDDVRDAFIDGYRGVRAISQEEIDLLPVFCKARYVWNYGDILAMADHLGVRGRLTATFWDGYFEKIRSMLREEDA